MNEAHQSNRSRVRSLLLCPLGFRFPKRVSEEEAKRRLDLIADNLSYLSDRSLMVLRDMLAAKGQGSDRDFWPGHAVFVGFAEVVQPRPLAELPALLSWFGSVEGPRAIAEGTLVETYDWIARRKVPPVTDQARALVSSEAIGNARRLQILDERLAAGRPFDPSEAEWANNYRRRQKMVADLVRRERAARGKEAAE